MRRIWGLLALLLLPLLLTAASCERQEDTAETATPGKAGAIFWFTNAERAVEEGRDRNKPLMIDFSASWCGYCRRLDEETYQDPRVIARSEEFVCLKIDVDTAHPLVLRYNVRGIPRILFTDADGNILRDVTGFRIADVYLREMDRALAVFRGGRD